MSRSQSHQRKVWREYVERHQWCDFDWMFHGMSVTRVGYDGLPVNIPVNLMFVDDVSGVATDQWKAAEAYRTLIVV